MTQMVILNDSDTNNNSLSNLDTYSRSDLESKHPPQIDWWSKGLHSQLQIQLHWVCILSIGYHWWQWKQICLKSDCT